MKYQVIGSNDEIVMTSNTVKEIYTRIKPTIDLALIRKELREIDYIIIRNSKGEFFTILSGSRKI